MRVHVRMCMCVCVRLFYLLPSGIDNDNCVGIIMLPVLHGVATVHCLTSPSVVSNLSIGVAKIEHNFSHLVPQQTFPSTLQRHSFNEQKLSSKPPDFRYHRSSHQPAWVKISKNDNLIVNKGIAWSSNVCYPSFWSHPGYMPMWTSTELWKKNIAMV